MRWEDFARQVPALASAGHERFDATGVLMLGTIRADGTPRISPIEFQFFEGELLLGGMWQSRKFIDLGRDPRCTLHSATSDMSGTEGDFKLYGTAIDVNDQGLRVRAAEANFAATGFRPRDPYHLFRIDVREAAFVAFADVVPRLAERLRADANSRVVVHHEDSNTDRYVIATWKA